MKTLTKAAISAAAVMAVTAGTLALTASAAVDAHQYDLPQVNYSARTDERDVTDITLSVLRYSVENYTTSGKRFYCVNSAGQQITKNAVKNGTESSMYTYYPYEPNYKWCSVNLRDTEREVRAINSLRYQNKPNAGSVKAYISNDQLSELNGTIARGFYIFTINDSTASSAATLSDIRLYSYLKGYEDY